MCTKCRIDINPSDEFEGKLLNILNGGMLSLMISIGHRTGLFDTMAGLEPATSEEIAAQTGLNERYVREWLGAMTASQIIECCEEGKTFKLPDAHAASLIRAAGAGNISIFAQYVSVLGGVEDKIVECFKSGGGVPYADYPRFHEVMAEDSGQSVGFSLIEAILPLAPGLIDDLQRGIEVLDIGCGSGRAINLLARHFPNSHFTGYDLSEEALTTARGEALSDGLTNVTFEQRDLTTFNADAPEGRFDFITAFDAIHDQARPDQVLAGIHRALTDDGLFLMQDIDGSSNPRNNIEHPMGAMLYTISCMHCMTVSLAQGGMGLGAMWGNELAQEMLTEAGFQEIQLERLEHDIQNCYHLCRKEAVPAATR